MTVTAAVYLCLYWGACYLGGIEAGRAFLALSAKVVWNAAIVLIDYGLRPLISFSSNTFVHLLLVLQFFMCFLVSPTLLYVSLATLAGAVLFLGGPPPRRPCNLENV